MSVTFKHLNTAALPEDWSADHFGNLVDFKLGKTPPRASSVYWKEGKYPWVSISDMTPHGVVTETAEKVSQEAYDTVFRGCLVPEGSLLMSFKLTIGRMSCLGIPAFHNEAIISFRPNSNTINEDYLRYYLSQINYKDYQDTAIKGQTLNKGKLNSLEIALPPLPEQKKIAHILSAVQRAIGTQERIIQTTIELFKGVLHKLMTAQLRVSDRRGVEEDFRETPSMSDSSLLIEPLPSGWENFQFGEVCNCVKDSHSPVEGGETPYVGLEHLARGFPAFVGRGMESDIKSSKTKFKIGDILFGKLRPYLRKGAQADFDGISSTDILVFRVEDQCASDFLKYLVHSDEFIDYAKSTTSGVQHPRTSWPSLKEFHLSLPALPEQKKIAYNLSIIQKRIDVAQTKKIKLEDLFRTLLHELMNAKIRVQDLKLIAEGAVS